MNQYFFDGQHLKGFNLPMSLDSDVGWDVYGANEADLMRGEMAAKVAGAFRALNLNADALSSLPFAIVDKAGNDYDISTDYQNKVGFMPNPQRLLRLWRKSLSMRNVAYGMFEKRRGAMELRYIAPDTMEIDVRPDTGIMGYWRKLGARRDYYPAPKNIVVPIIRTDWDTEIMPSKETEFSAFADAVGILYYSNHYVKEFFARGGIKPHMLMVKGVPTKDERERMENTFSRMMAGIYRYFGKVWNAESMTPVPLGTGVDDFKDNGFYKQALEDIAITTGIPLSLLLANSANLATARTEYKSWYDNSVIPWADFIAHELNDNLFSRFDLRFEFRTEQTDPDQEEEVRRSQSFVNYAGVLLKNGHPKALSISAQIVGIDLPPDMDFDDLDERDESRIQTPPQLQQPKQDETGTPAMDAAVEEQPDMSGEKSVFVPNAEQITELETWQDIARRKIGKGQVLTLPLTAKHLPADIADIINARLEGVVDVAGVKQAFDLSTMTQKPEYKSEIIMLAEAINKLAEADKE